MQCKMKCHRLSDVQQGGRLFLLCWTVYFASYVGRYNYSAVMGAMQADGILPLERMGVVATAYFVCYGIGQLVNGLLGNLLNPFRLILWGLAAAGLANLLMGCLSASVLLVVVWGANGFFQSMLWPPIVRIFAEVMPEEQQAGACLNIASTSPAGTLASYLLAALTLTAGSWRWTFGFSGLVMLAACLLWAVAIRPIAQQCYRAEMADTPATNRFVAKKNTLLPVTLGVLMLLVAASVIHGAIKDGVASWVPTMIQSQYGVAAGLAAVLTMVLPVTNLSGAYIAHWIDKRWMHNEIKTCMVLFCISCGSLMTMVWSLQASMPLTLLLLAITTAAMLGINTLLIGVLPVRLGQNGNAAILSGWLNATTYFGAALASGGIGLLVGWTGWTAAILAWAASAVVALGCCLLLYKKLPKNNPVL